MSHDHHASLPGYAEGQIMVDGCGECEHRAQQPFDVQVSHLDPGRFTEAWVRSARWTAGDGVKVSAAEVGLLRGLSAVRHQLNFLGQLVDSLRTGT